MRKKYILPIVFLNIFTYGQMGINNISPKSTLDVVSKTTDGSTAEGFIIPRITGATLKAAETAEVYGQDQDAILVYVTQEPEPDDRTGQVEGMDSPGFYHFDAGANRWVKMLTSGTDTALIGQLMCSSATDIGILEAGEPAAGVYTTIPYSGGNGGPYSGIVIPSTGVTGLSAVLSSGTLNNGSGNLNFNIIGTANSVGTAVFNLEIGGESCGFSRTVLASSVFPDALAVIVNGQTRQMLTRNLGADPTQDPNIPTQAIMGSYYQWGRLAPKATSYTGSNAISGWNTAAAADNAWNSGTDASPIKTGNDPCPTGFRVPTRNEWTGFNTASTTSNIGTWASTSTNGAANFGAAKVFTNNGNVLTFPTAGYRDYPNGALGGRAFNGYYWSITINGTAGAYRMNFSNSAVIVANSSIVTNGFSVRCISQ